MFGIKEKFDTLRDRIKCKFSEDGHEWERKEIRQDRENWETVRQQKPELARYMEENGYRGVYHCEECSHMVFYPNTTIKIER